MGISIGMVTIDCPDPQSLAEFWTAALGTTVRAMLPATVESYLWTPRFSVVGVDKNEDELKIYNSTPGNRMPPKSA